MMSREPEPINLKDELKKIRNTPNEEMGEE